ncbi:hypothetical protein MACJ_003113 [Theileria orientalis]|uniref:Uncharacterized protein n=1 Tax=Theileria orientalis TaxID=68886 RepID=A0A976M796_THEOR|nr:hypothetical protein MACJ_003113 [Theileria orientalis]
MATNQTNAANNKTSILNDAIHKLDESMKGHGGGEFTSGLMAFTMYMFVQIASIISRHMAVALKIPQDTTGIYFTKLFAARGLVSVISSIMTYLIKLFISEDNIILTLIFSSLLLISRSVFIFFLHLERNRTLYVYNVLIMEAMCMGLFQITFYPLAADYVSAISLCFKISRLWIFLLQLVMDLAIFDKPMLMVKIHYWLAYILSFISTGFWFYFCITRHKGGSNKRPKPTSTPKLTKDAGTPSQNTNDTQCVTASEQEMSLPTKDPESLEDKIRDSEPSFFEHLGNSFSPLMMCFVTMMMKNILFPGLLPYGLLERDKSHIVNMSITPVGLTGTSIVHALKKNVDSINRRWKWYWHLLWFLAIPPAIIFYKTLESLHPRSSSARSKIINNRVAVLVMALVFHFCHSLIESSGYLGVVSNVKYCNKVRERGRKMVSTNQLLAEIIHFIFYKIAIGYNVTRISLGYHLPKFRPNHRMSRHNLFVYILRETFVRGYDDFIKDFKMNIREYI